MKQEELETKISLLEHNLAEARAKLSALQQGQVTICYGVRLGEDLGRIRAASAEAPAVAEALEKHINDNKFTHLVGGLKVWINDDLATVRTLYVQEHRKFTVTPF